MNYADGETVELGDRLSIMPQGEGVVVALIGEDKFSSAYPAEDWAYLAKGALIEFVDMGLVYYETDLDPDIRLVARASSLAP